MGRGTGVMDAAWQEFTAEIRRWRDAGRKVEFWWRDDDAGRPEKALTRLFRLAARFDVPLALAVIPACLDLQLFAALPPQADILQHGADHLNRAAPGEKKTEYPASETIGVAAARLAEGGRRLAALAGPRSLGVLAPPWNRIAEHLLPRLPSCGLHGLSRYGARRNARAAPGVVEINTHVDIIGWKSGRGFVGEVEALAQATRHLIARRERVADAEEPTGWLTHHACHDEAAWTFLAQLFERMRAEQGVRWKSARELFSGMTPARP